MQLVFKRALQMSRCTATENNIESLLWVMTYVNFHQFRRCVYDATLALIVNI